MFAEDEDEEDEEDKEGAEQKRGGAEGGTKEEGGGGEEEEEEEEEEEAGMGAEERLKRQLLKQYLPGIRKGARIIEEAEMRISNLNLCATN